MKILNFGSLNQDYVYQVSHIVKEGETLSSNTLQLYPGGKGLNQSVALSRAGASVYHAGLIGEDGVSLRELCKENAVDVSFISTCDVRTGNAIIQVDDTGQNSIILFPGANHQVSEQMINEVLSHFGKNDVLLLQNEINRVDEIIEMAYKAGLKIVLNPSPYNEELKKCNLEHVSMLILNEVEGMQMTGFLEPVDIMHSLIDTYHDMEVVLTLGDKGSYYASGSERIYQQAVKTKAVDTTAAGDTFTGYFMKEYFVSEQPPTQALKVASVAAALSIQKKGATVSIPMYNVVADQLEDIG